MQVHAWFVHLKGTGLRLSLTTATLPKRQRGCEEALRLAHDSVYALAAWCGLRTLQPGRPSQHALRPGTRS